MPHYRFRAVNSHGLVLKGRMEAANENHLEARLAEMGYELLSMRLKQRAETGGGKRKRDRQRHLSLLFVQLESLTNAGVSLTGALEEAARAMPDSNLRDAVRAILYDLRDGVDFADACARQKRFFTPALVALLRTGMVGGSPAGACRRARAHLEWQTEMSTMLRRALRYPLFLLALSFGAVSFMLAAVVPQLVDFLTAQNTVLPWSTRLLIALAQQFTWLWWSMPLMMGVAVGTAVLLQRLVPWFEEISDRFLLKMPVFGGIIAKTESAYFLHHMALMAKSSALIIPSLKAARDAVTNRAVRKQIEAVMREVEEGGDLAEAMERQDLFAGLIARRMQIGLQSDSLVEQLEQASQECDAEAVARSKALIGSLEPGLTIFVGLILAWIVLAVIAPLYQSLAQLGAGP